LVALLSSERRLLLLLLLPVYIKLVLSPIILLLLHDIIHPIINILTQIRPIHLPHLLMLVHGHILKALKLLLKIILHLLELILRLTTRAIALASGGLDGMPRVVHYYYYPVMINNKNA
jgi:hypothetical protein